MDCTCHHAELVLATDVLGFDDELWAKLKEKPTETMPLVRPVPTPQQWRRQQQPQLTVVFSPQFESAAKEFAIQAELIRASDLSEDRKIQVPSCDPVRSLLSQLL